MFDQAGVTTSEDYDFKGNILVSRRRLASDYKAIPDWSASPQLSSEEFTGSTTYDALSRPLSATSPDGSIYRPAFNEANLLERIDVKLRGAQTATPFVTNIDYNARGQRTQVSYGNGTTAIQEFDPLTFRLTHLKTTRTADQAVLQDLAYTYDPGGNITHIRDRAQQTIYFDNQVVTPDKDYTYDSIYRLVKAEGREHIGQVAEPQTTSG